MKPRSALAAISSEVSSRQFPLSSRTSLNAEPTPANRSPRRKNSLNSTRRFNGRTSWTHIKLKDFAASSRVLLALLAWAYRTTRPRQRTHGKLWQCFHSNGRTANGTILLSRANSHSRNHVSHGLDAAL